jgi:hypothetical protein
MLPVFELAKIYCVFARTATVFGIIIIIIIIINNFMLGPVHCFRFAFSAIGLQKPSICIQFLSHILNLFSRSLFLSNIKICLFVV